MKITNKELFTIIEADEGMILIDKDGYGSTMIYLGIYDSPENYTEIPVGEYVEPEPETPEEPEQPSNESTEDMIQRIFQEEVNK